MSDDLTARIAELLKRRVRCGRTADRYLVGGEARPLLAEARDEITRLREGVERHRTAGIADNCGKPGCLTGCGHDSRLWALLDAPSTASPVRDGTNTEQDEP